MAIVFFNLAIGCISLMSAATANFMQLGLFRDEILQIPSGNFKMDQDIRLIATKNIRLHIKVHQSDNVQFP